jgi:para-nitrobenzyl esterase
MLTAWTNFAEYSDPNGPKGGEWAPCTEQNPKFMVFKLNDKDAEASVFGEPEIAPQQGFGGFGGFPGGARPGGPGAPGAPGAGAPRR